MDLKQGFTATITIFPRLSAGRINNEDKSNEINKDKWTINKEYKLNVNNDNKRNVNNEYKLNVNNENKSMKTEYEQKMYLQAVPKKRTQILKTYRIFIFNVEDINGD